MLLICSCKNYCDSVSETKAEIYSGIVAHKEIEDWNHGSKHIMIKDKLNTSSYLYVTNDRSGFWEYIEKGDSIFKEKVSFRIDVYRNNVKKTFKIDLGCE